MGKIVSQPRQIAFFVEGDTERGDARTATLPDFFRRWLRPQLPEGKQVGIKAVKFQGVSNYLKDFVQKLRLHLETNRVHFVFGLVDLYGFPADQLDLNTFGSVKEKVRAVQQHIHGLVPKEFRNQFRQHVAVHEVEAWLLAYPEEWPSALRDQIAKRKPEQVNFKEPPAEFLKRLLGTLGKKYKKTNYAKALFPTLDLQVAMKACPFLRAFAEDLLLVAKNLVETEQ